MRNRLAAGLMVLAMACGGGSSAPKGALPPIPDPNSKTTELLPDTVTAKKAYTIGFSYPAFNFAFFTQGIDYGAVQECKRLKITCKFTFGAGYDKCEIQVNDMENLIAQKVDGIVLTACSDTSLTPVIDTAYDSGIVVTSFSIPSTSKKYYGYEGYDHYAQGVTNAALLRQCLEKKGLTSAKMLYVTGPKGAFFTPPREKALSDVMKGATPPPAWWPTKSWGPTGYVVVAEQYTDQSRAETIRVTEDLLTAHPDVSAIDTQTADQAMGIIQVLKSHGYKPGQVCVVGGDVLADEYVQAMNDNWLYGMSTLTAVVTGEQAIRLIVDRLNGDQHPFFIAEPDVALTKDNLDTFDRTKSLGPSSFVPPARVSP